LKTFNNNRHINKQKKSDTKLHVKTEYLPFGCNTQWLGVVNRSLSSVVAWSRVILGFLSVLNWGSVRGCVICGLFGVVVGDFVISVGCRVGNWSLGVVFQFNVVRRSSCCVVSLGYVILGRLNCGYVLRGREYLSGSV
jgi:hypothetical protein